MVLCLASGGRASWSTWIPRELYLFVSSSDEILQEDECNSFIKRFGLTLYCPNCIDLERILEEQDTHDLYCPNCNSCITKRVILQKRKWSVREIQHDMPSKKVHEEQYDAERLDTASVSGEMTNLADAPEPDVFRCLSCFSFFIPDASVSEGGFNIFRIFE